MTDELEEIREQKLESLRDRVESGDGGVATGDADDPDTASTTPEAPISVHGKEELLSTVGDHSVVLVDFYADWCGPCQALEPVVETVAAETNAAVAKVDVDANQQLAGEYGVRGVPTLLLFADGEPVEQLVGMQSESQLRSLVESAGA